MPADRPATIEVVSSTRLVPALTLLLSDEPAAEQLSRVTAVLQANRKTARPFEDFLTAVRGDTLAGAVWGQPLPGRAVCLWTPKLAAGEPQQLAVNLLVELDRRLSSRQVAMIQAVLRPSRSRDAGLLADCGYDHVADLAYLFCEGGQLNITPPTRRLQFVPYETCDRQRMQSIVEATYDGTLDVPSLNGVRRMCDVLDGYQPMEAATAAHWFFARRDDADVGCLMLAHHRHQQQWELVYMGVVPEVRGQGFGEEIVAFAQRQVAGADSGRLVLAVDSANEPALRIYCRAGFTQCDRRDVFIKIPGRERLSVRPN